uniref:Uncharacterized protein n=1 Tax=Arion vulgaris TaxID=1028688 RepID=A0A0B6ZUN6_9EUPU
MLFLVATFVLLTAYTVDGDAAETPCLTNLNQCTNVFSQARKEDWDALLTYNDCTTNINCPEDEYATSIRESMLADIESRKMDWGRDWDLRNASPYQSPTSTVLVIPAVAMLRCIF